MVERDAPGGGLGCGAAGVNDTRSTRFARQPFLLRHRGGHREPVISPENRQLGCLPSMIQPPLLGVVKAASAVSARTLTWRAPAVPRSCSMLSVYMAVRVRPFPRLPPLDENGCGPSTLISPA